MTSSSYIIPVIAMMCFSACQPTPQEKRLKLLLAEEKGFFRNIYFDMNAEEVRQLETAPLANSLDDYLRYEIYSSDHPAEFLQIEYFFNKNRLDRIMIFYNLSYPEDTDKLFEAVQSYFSQKFGNSLTSSNEWQHWKITDKTGLPGTIEIMLSKQTSSDMTGIDIELVKYYKSDS